MVSINPNPTTLYLEPGADLIVSQTGGIVLANGWDQIRQRILRRIFTNSKFVLQDGTPVPSDYIFDTRYGLSFRALIGQNFTKTLRDQMQSICYQAAIIDEGVDPGQPPEITISQSEHT